MIFLLFFLLPAIGFFAGVYYTYQVKQEGLAGFKVMDTIELNRWYWTRVLIGSCLITPIFVRIYVLFTADLSLAKDTILFVIFTVSAMGILAILFYLFSILSAEVMIEVRRRRSQGDQRVVQFPPKKSNKKMSLALKTRPFINL